MESEIWKVFACPCDKCDEKMKKIEQPSLTRVNPRTERTCVLSVTSAICRSIKYLPCFAAAGAKLQFYAILAEGGLTTRPHPMSPTYDLTKPIDRARVGGPRVLCLWSSNPVLLARSCLLLSYNGRHANH